jgi:hypothetical protein
MTPDAASYQANAAEMRRYAEEARDAGSRQRFLDVAQQYDKLAERAQQRQRQQEQPREQGLTG